MGPANPCEAPAKSIGPSVATLLSYLLMVAALGLLGVTGSPRLPERP